MIKRIIVEDFPEQKSWIGKLLEPLNSSLDSMKRLLNKGLTFQDNFRAQIKTLEFLYDGTTFPLYFACTLPVRPQGLIVIDAQERSGSPASFANAVFPTWEYTQDGRVKINNLTGLTSGRRYFVTFLTL